MGTRGDMPIVPPPLSGVLKDTGRLLGAFVLGSIGTTIGTLVALKLLPLASLGEHGWKMASALMSRHIGGAVRTNHSRVRQRKGYPQADWPPGKTRLQCPHCSSMYLLQRVTIMTGGPPIPRVGAYSGHILGIAVLPI
eukprot:6215797-Pyramimonas_sp.AAC.1